MSDGRKSVMIALVTPVLPITKSDPAYCCFTFEVMKTFRSRANPAPWRATL